MQRRYIIGALAGGILGFSVQFIGDNLLLHPVYKNSAGDCEWITGTRSQFNFLASGEIDRYVANTVPQKKLQARGHELVYQELLILWVRDRAEQAVRTAILTAFWVACVILAADRITEFMKKKQLPSK